MFSPEQREKMLNLLWMERSLNNFKKKRFIFRSRPIHLGEKVNEDLAGLSLQDNEPGGLCLWGEMFHPLGVVLPRHPQDHLTVEPHSVVCHVLQPETWYSYRPWWRKKNRGQCISLKTISSPPPYTKIYSSQLIFYTYFALFYPF